MIMGGSFCTDVPRLVLEKGKEVVTSTIILSSVMLISADSYDLRVPLEF